MASKRIVKYLCPFCDKRFTREDLIDHVEDKHEEMIPEGFTVLRYVFNYVNKKPLDYHGKCTECGGPTPWDENKARYDRQCGKKACHDSYVKKFEQNMMKTRGVTRISSTAEGQKKMLANRKISGKYKFADGGIKEYTGKYERDTLEFMDKVLHIKSDDVLAPGPILEYTYEGKVHMYITDFYYQPYNLIIEVKDGGNNPNKRNMPEYRGKQIAKEKYIIKHTNFNYLRLTNNDLSQLLSVFADLKYQLLENSGERVIHVNENVEENPVHELMTAMSYSPIVGITDADAYIIHNMQNNVFSVGVGTHFNDVIGPDNSNKLNHIEIPKEDYDKLVLYKLPIDRKEVSKRLKDYMGESVDNKFVYEKLMNQTMYTYDQIQFQGLEVIDLNPYKKHVDKIKEYCGSDMKENQVEVVYNVVEEIARKYNLKRKGN